MNKFMKCALNEANKGIDKNEGGPFGCVITDKEGKIIAKGHNEVLKNNDPTCHAEVVTIRKACKRLKTYDLQNCILYTSCEPCPMCLSAIIWANIKEVYYGCTKKDADKIGFRDDLIYNYLEKRQEKILKMSLIDREKCLEAFEKYNALNKTIY